MTKCRLFDTALLLVAVVPLAVLGLNIQTAVADPPPGCTAPCTELNPGDPCPQAPAVSLACAGRTQTQCTDTTLAKQSIRFVGPFNCRGYMLPPGENACPVTCVTDTKDGAALEAKCWTEFPCSWSQQQSMCVAGNGLDFKANLKKQVPCN